MQGGGSDGDFGIVGDESALVVDAVELHGLFVRSVSAGGVASPFFCSFLFGGVLSCDAKFGPIDYYSFTS